LFAPFFRNFLSLNFVCLLEDEQHETETATAWIVQLNALSPRIHSERDRLGGVKLASAKAHNRPELHKAGAGSPSVAPVIFAGSEHSRK
jgi:hypothetical protein